MKRTVAALFCLLLTFHTIADAISDVDSTTIWNQIETKFLGGGIIDQTRYETNILIQLKGNVLPQDSAFFRDLAVQLKNAIDVWDVDIVPKTGNVVFEINMPGNEGIANNIYQRSGAVQIIETLIKLNISPETSFEVRKKILYYYFMRSLIVMQTTPKGSMYVKGCVFDEKSPENITFHPMDWEIIKTAYSSDFSKKYKKEHKNVHFSLSYLTLKYRIQSRFFFNFLGLATAAVFLFLMFGYFSKKKIPSYGTFLKQGLIVFGAFFIYYIFSNLVVDQLYMDRWSDVILGLLFLIGIAFLSVHLIYFFEKIFLGKQQQLWKNVMAPLFSTALLPPLSFFVISFLFDDITTPVRTMMFGNLLFFSSCISIIRALYIFLETKSRNIISQKDVELARLSELNKQAELQSLQSKINPHFLYNALNSIASLAGSDAKKTEKMALALSDFFKYSLNKEQKEKVSLKEEIQSVETYLEIEKVRFGDKLNYQLYCPGELKNIEIPQFLIQPLIENAVKHGVSKITGKGEIRLEINQLTNVLEIRVFDNGPAFSDGPFRGTDCKVFKKN